MARSAFILHQGSPGSRELRRAGILDWFGVHCQFGQASQLEGMDGFDSECAVFGSLPAIAEMFRHAANHSASLPSVRCYAYVDDDRTLSVNALQSLVTHANLSLQTAPTDNLPVSISKDLPDLTGPMAGLSFALQLKTEDALLTGVPIGDPAFTTIISASSAAVFVNFARNGVSVFLNASSQMVDIDQPVGRGYYDVKDHFCSVVPLVMFIKFAFRDVAWRPQELSACLIIDDPLLQSNYGFCDFSKLRDLMERNEFTTNIAFIPWNWR